MFTASFTVVFDKATGYHSLPNIYKYNFYILKFYISPSQRMSKIYINTKYFNFQQVYFSKKKRCIEPNFQRLMTMHVVPLSGLT